MTLNLGGVGRSIGVECTGGVVEGPNFVGHQWYQERRRHTYQTGSGSMQNCEITRRVVRTRDGKAEGGIEKRWAQVSVKP